MGRWARGGVREPLLDVQQRRRRAIVLPNDLFVVEGQRGAGIGRRLIEFSLRRAEERGASRLEWRTELDNRVAQRLYEKFDAVRIVWFTYALYPGLRK